jgi:hypothetical protein
MAKTYTGPQLAAVMVYLLKCTDLNLEEHIPDPGNETPEKRDPFDRQLNTYFDAADATASEDQKSFKNGIEQMKQFKAANDANKYQVLTAHLAIASLLTALKGFKPTVNGNTTEPLWGECRPVSYKDVFKLAGIPLANS